MINDEKITTIKFPGLWVNQKAIDVLTDNTQNTYIWKANTGQGVTTAMLNHPIGNLYILSPNVGMITGKEKDENGRRIAYKSHRQFFIYHKSDDGWNDVQDYLDTTDISEQNMVLNTTPDQLWILWKTRPELYERIIQIHVFVDEIDSYIKSVTLRKTMGAVLELIYNQWKASFTLSTATPTYNLLDVPKDKGVKCYKLIREIDPVKIIQYSEDSKHLEDFVYDQLAKRRPVLIFSNNINVHKKFKDPELRVLNLVGDNLRLKLEPFKRGNLQSNINHKNYDIIILSSKYFAGYDIRMDCSICIVSNQVNEAKKINIQNLVQSYGRGRNIVHDALYINIRSTFNDDTLPNSVPMELKDITNAVSIFESKLIANQSLVERAGSYLDVSGNEYITQAMHVNRSLLFSQARDTINDYHQYNKEVFDKTLNDYNFKVTDYVSSQVEYQRHSTTKLNERLLNLLEKPEWDFRRDYPKVKYNIRHLKKGAFNSKLALEYLTAWIFTQCDCQVMIDKLGNKTFSAKGFYKSVNLFLRANVDNTYYYNKLSQKEMGSAKRLYLNESIQEKLANIKDLTNDWQILYMIYRINTGDIPEEIKHDMTTHIEAHNLDIYEKFKHDTDNRTRNVFRAITRRLEAMKEQLSNEELGWLKEVVKDVYDRLDKGEDMYPVTQNSLKNQMTDYLLFLLNNGNGYHNTFHKKSREYNAMVNLPKAFRKITPLIYLMIDLTSATPQLIDRILGTDIGLDVYSNLMEKKKTSREKAKALFNSTVNNHKLKVKTARKLYLDAGYSSMDALKLARMTAQVNKGSFYERITTSEKRVIENYQKVLSPRSYRFHDGMVVSQESIDEYQIVIPTSMDGFNYHVEVFNDGTEYTGPMTHVPHESTCSIEDYLIYKNLSA